MGERQRIALRWCVERDFESAPRTVVPLPKGVQWAVLCRFPKNGRGPPVKPSWRREMRMLMIARLGYPR